MTHGRTPYGYRRVIENGTERLEIDEEESRIVRMIFTWYNEGDESGAPLSIKGITRKLTDMRVPTYADKRSAAPRKKQARGCWCTASVAQILKNETYAGTWRYGKCKNSSGPRRNNPPEHVITVQVPPIVSREQWLSTQARREHNRKHHRCISKHKYLLARRLKCGDCGRHLAVHAVNRKTPSGRKVYKYYYCVAKERGMPDCSQGKCFRADAVDEVIWDWVCGFLSDPEVLLRGLAEFAAQREAEALPRRERLAVVMDLIEENRLQMNKILDLYLTGEFPRDLLLESRQNLENTFASLEAERANLLAQLEAETVGEDQILSIQAFSAKVAEGLKIGSTDFSARRRIIEVLNVTARLAIEDDDYVVYAQSLVGDAEFSLLSKSTSG